MSTEPSFITEDGRLKCYSNIAAKNQYRDAAPCHLRSSLVQPALVSLTALFALEMPGPIREHDAELLVALVEREAGCA